MADKLKPVSIDVAAYQYPENSGNPVISNANDVWKIAGGVVYDDPKVEQILKGNVGGGSSGSGSGSQGNKQSQQVSDGILLMDIAQSHHYTVTISEMSMSKLRTPNGTFSEFLPVKSMNLRYTSYENMSIPVAIFGDFPLLNKKRVSTIDLVCYDYDNSKLEYELREWEAGCFPKGRFVAYMDDIAREFIYRGYGVDGRKTLEYRVFVIPSGNVSVSRDYSANDAKLLNFSLVVVGDGRTCASGTSNLPQAQKGNGGGLFELWAEVGATNKGEIIYRV